MGYELAICELYIPHVHGFCQIKSTTDVINHFIVRETICLSEFMQEIDLDSSQHISYKNYIRYVKSQWNSIQNISHGVIRNISNIVKNPNYIKLEIIEILILSKGEHVAILKTFWLRILQRRYKKYFYKKQKYIIKMKNPKHIYYRRVLGNNNNSLF